ncbi:MAG: DUF1297 domain-containing protein [Candidatus Hodarchaeales archaeon]|jgi:5-formaminoimidazole-4-carboxamide-1-(beta)-D-ribofuranosyl 5'-monophosphate synthetase
MVTIGIFGSHSAEETAVAAKRNGFETVIACQEGREDLYLKYNRFLFDHVILLSKFEELILPENQDKLQELDTIFIPNRSFSVYVGHDNIEQKFDVPLYGNRKLLRIEDRSFERDQYWLMERAGIRMPRQYTIDNIDELVIVKVQQKDKPLERAFFYVTSTEEFEEKAEILVNKGVVDEKEVYNSPIEEFIIGPRFNANFQAYGCDNVFGRFDFVGFDDRVQTNLMGMLNLPARDQLKIDVPLKNEEVGHKGLTMRESKKPLVYRAAEKFLDAVEKHFPPKHVGLFALQGAVNENSEFIVFDVSPRVPGSPCIGPTSPEMHRLAIKFKKSLVSPLELCMFDIQQAIKVRRIEDITT